MKGIGKRFDLLHISPKSGESILSDSLKKFL